MDPNVVIFTTWFAVVIALVVLNRWSMKRKPVVVIDFDPSQPAIHWEE